MKYKHLSQIERYQISSLMKAQQTITQIAELLRSSKSTISRELRRNVGLSWLSPETSLRNGQGALCGQSQCAHTIEPWVKEQANDLISGSGVLSRSQASCQ